MSLYTCA